MRAFKCWAGHRWEFVVMDYSDGPGRHRTCARCGAEDEAYNLLSDEIHILSVRGRAR